MSDTVKLIIEIPRNEYKYTCERTLSDRTMWDDAIRKGTPLPKGHGRLIDEERLKETIHRNVVGDLFDELIDMQPTIIEAERGE